MTGPFEGPTSGVLTSLVLPGFHMSFNSLLTFLFPPLKSNMFRKGASLLTKVL